MLWVDVQPGTYMTDGTRLLEVVHRTDHIADVVDCATDRSMVLSPAQTRRLRLVRATHEEDDAHATA